MKRTTVDGYLLVNKSSDSGETTFSLEEPVVGTYPDIQNSTLFVSSKIVFLQMTRKPKDKRLANEENKQLDPGGKGGESPL